MVKHLRLLVLMIMGLGYTGAVTTHDCSDTFHTDGVAYFSWKLNSNLTRGTTTWDYSPDGTTFNTMMTKSLDDPANPSAGYIGLVEETCRAANNCPSGDDVGMIVKNATTGTYRVRIAFTVGGQETIQEDLHVNRRPDLNESTILESCGEVCKQIKATYPLVMRVDLRKARITPPDITIHDGDTSLQCRQSFYCELTINSNKAYAVIDLGKDDTVIKAGGCLFHPSYPMMLGLLISLLLKFKLE